MTGWAAAYIGTPWVAGQSDCWHFARRVWAERFSWDVPAICVDASDPRQARRAFATGHESTGWMPIAGVCGPQDGDAVLMAMGRHPCHVGIHVQDMTATVLHSVEGAGVVYTPLSLIGGMGYRLVGLYRWRG